MKTLLFALVTMVGVLFAGCTSSEEIIENLQQSGKLDSEFKTDGYSLKGKTAEAVLLKGRGMLGKIATHYEKQSVSEEATFFLIHFNEAVSLEYVKHTIDQLEVGLATEAELIRFFKQQYANIPSDRKIVALRDEDFVSEPSPNFFTWSEGYLYLSKSISFDRTEFSPEAKLAEIELFNVQNVYDNNGEIAEKYNTVFSPEYSFLVKVE